MAVAAASVSVPLAKVSVPSIEPLLSPLKVQLPVPILRTFKSAFEKSLTNVPLKVPSVLSAPVISVAAVCAAWKFLIVPAPITEPSCRLFWPRMSRIPPAPTFTCVSP